MIGGKKKQISQRAIGSIVVLRHATASYRSLSLLIAPYHSITGSHMPARARAGQPPEPACLTSQLWGFLPMPKLQGWDRIHYFCWAQFCPPSWKSPVWARRAGTALLILPWFNRCAPSSCSPSLPALPGEQPCPNMLQWPAPSTTPSAARSGSRMERSRAAVEEALPCRDVPTQRAAHALQHFRTFP